MQINIEDVKVKGNNILYTLNYPKSLRKYLLRNTFFIQYDGVIDISKVNHSILMIPIMSMVAPFAWAVGADVEVDTLDQTYFHSLYNIKDVLGKWYPQFSLSSTISVRKLENNQFSGSRTGLLFSGGLDSITSYVRHKVKKLYIIPVQSVDPGLQEEDRWNDLLELIKWLASRDDVNVLPVKTNLTQLNEPLLAYEFKLIDWYSAVAHGLLYLSLCAPITADKGIGTVYIASSHTQEYTRPWGSHPEIDNLVTWANVKSIHDGYDLSRQQKIKYVYATDPEYLTQLRVCPFSLKNNCTRCEKCFRTIVGLCIVGMDPRKCHFNINTRTLKTIKKALLNGNFPIDESELFMWLDIQRNIPENIDFDICGSREFLIWLKNYRLTQHPMNAWHHLLNSTRINLLKLYHSIINIRRKPKESIRFFQFILMCYLHLFLVRSLVLRRSSVKDS